MAPPLRSRRPSATTPSPDSARWGITSNGAFASSVNTVEREGEGVGQAGVQLNYGGFFAAQTAIQTPPIYGNGESILHSLPLQSCNHVPRAHRFISTFATIDNALRQDYIEGPIHELIP